MPVSTNKLILPTTQQSTFTTIQAGRGIAAILVVLFHAGPNIFASTKYWGFDPTFNIFAFGHAGVYFFFVLSGFIIMHVHWKDVGQRERVKRYLQKRLFRIYPIYWLILASIIPIYYLFPSFGQGHERDPLVLLSSITLFHFNTDKTILGVSWTLYHEILFYLVFSIAIFHRRSGFLIMGLWLLASATSLTVSDRSYPLAFFASPLHLLFGMGMAACWLFKRNFIPFPRTLTLLGASIFIATGTTEIFQSKLFDEDALALLYGISSAMAICGATAMERLGLIQISGALRLLGDASYSIYLTHYPVLSIFAKTFIATGGRDTLHPLISFILVVIAAIAVGVLTHLLIERPMTEKIQNFLILRNKRGQEYVADH